MRTPTQQPHSICHYVMSDRRLPHRNDAKTFLERNPIWLNRTTLLSLCWSMIFSQNRFPLLRIMLLILAKRNLSAQARFLVVRF